MQIMNSNKTKANMVEPEADWSERFGKDKTYGRRVSLSRKGSRKGSKPTQTSQALFLSSLQYAELQRIIKYLREHRKALLNDIVLLIGNRHRDKTYRAKFLLMVLHAKKLVRIYHKKPQWARFWRTTIYWVGDKPNPNNFSDYVKKEAIIDDNKQAELPKKEESQG